MAILNLEAAVRNVIGTDVQAYDAFLTSIATLGTAADKLIYTTAVDTAAETPLTAFARTILDDADEATFKATVNLEIGTDVQAYDAELAALAGLTSAANKLPYFTGSGTAAVTDLTSFARSILDDADEATFKATVNLEIGTDVLAQQTIGIADNNLLEVDGSPNDDEYARFTANGLEGRTEAEFKGDFSLAIGTDVQAYDATLAALAAYNTNGLLTQTASDTFAGRTIIGTANQVVVSDGDGVSGNPTLSTPQDIHSTATPTFASATLSGANGLDVNPGSDTDADLVTVGVTGAPKLWWDESEDGFIVTNGLQVDSSAVYPVIIRSSNASWAGFQQRATASGARPYIEWNNSADNETGWIELDPTNQRLGFYYDNYWMTIENGGDVRIGTAAAAARGQLEVDQASITGAQPVLLLDQADVSEEFINFTISGDQNMVLAKLSITGNPTIEWNHSARAFAMSDGLRLTSSLTYPMIISGDDGSWVGFQQLATTSGAKPYIEWNNSADSELGWIELDPTNQRLGFYYDNYWMTIENGGDVRIGTAAAAARGQLEVDQASTTGAQPVLLLDQADVSEEMIEFISTIGVGNAIEAIGGKTLTTTHFIKVTLPGPLTRYIPVGTIA